MRTPAYTIFSTHIKEQMQIPTVTFHDVSAYFHWKTTTCAPDFQVSHRLREHKETIWTLFLRICVILWDVFVKKFKYIL